MFQPEKELWERTKKVLIIANPMEIACAFYVNFFRERPRLMGFYILSASIALGLSSNWWPVKGWLVLCGLIVIHSAGIYALKSIKAEEERDFYREKRNDFEQALKDSECVSQRYKEALEKTQAELSETTKERKTLKKTCAEQKRALDDFRERYPE